MGVDRLIGLERNLLTGTEDIPFGLKVGHTWHEIGVIFHVVEAFGIRGFVELGVHEGGLAALMVARTFYRHDFHYLGVELDAGVVRTELKDMLAVANPQAAQVIYGDVFSDSVKQDVQAFMARVGRQCLLYCDDGDKPRELREYAPLIRPNDSGIKTTGDILMVHDFWDGQREPQDLFGYGSTLDFPRAEVLPADVKQFAPMAWSKAVPSWLAETRIAAYFREGG